MPLDDSSANCQPDAASGSIGAVEPFEGHEDLLVVFGADSDSIVAAGEQTPGALLRRGNLDTWARIGPVVDRIRDQVLKQLHQVRVIDAGGGQRVVGDDGAGL